MNTQFGFAKWLVISIALFGVATLAYCATPSSFWQGKIDFEYTGQVLDADTKAPIEGAYVLAIYERVDSGLAATVYYCVKTKGMLTGKDGKFNFPVEKRDNLSPVNAVAIKADYFFKSSVVAEFAVQDKQNKETYSNRHIYLKKQDPADLKFDYGYTTCKRPESREAVAANIEFLKIERTEMSRIASKFDWFPSYIKTSDSMIRGLEDKP
jgi:hypothetical protein